jgi:diguanylate cyclase (GGDEF)-like protein/PAS domain S-box-containing protein
MPNDALPVPILARQDRVTNQDRRLRHARASVALSPHLVAVIDGEGNIVDVEPAVIELFGYLPADLIGTSGFRFVHPDDHAALADELLTTAESRAGRDWTPRIKVAHADGSYREVEVLAINRMADPMVGGLVVAIHDTSGSSMRARVLAATDFIYQSLETMASDGTTIFDSRGDRVFSSPSMVKLLGYTEDEFEQIPAAGLVCEEDRSIWDVTVHNCLSTPGSAQRCEIRIKRKDGSPMWVETTAMNLLDDPDVRGVVAHIRDIDERRRAQDELRRIAMTDDLTGLGNRASLMQRLRNVNQTTGPVSLMFCDLDRFKRINDRYGHDVGDLLLVDVARAITANLDDSAFAARIGGDEFCILMRADEQTTRMTADQISTAVEAIVVENRHQQSSGVQRPQIGVSIGIASGEAATVTGSALLSEADHAMYSQKRRKRSVEPSQSN